MYIRSELRASKCSRDVTGRRLVKLLNALAKAFYQPFCPRRYRKWEANGSVRTPPLSSWRPIPLSFLPDFSASAFAAPPRSRWLVAALCFSEVESAWSFARAFCPLFEASAWMLCSWSWLVTCSEGCRPCQVELTREKGRMPCRERGSGLLLRAGRALAIGGIVWLNHKLDWVISARTRVEPGRTMEIYAYKRQNCRHVRVTSRVKLGIRQQHQKSETLFLSTDPSTLLKGFSSETRFVSCIYL